MSEHKPIDELEMRMMQAFVDHVVREGSEPVPFTAPATAAVTEIPANDIPALTGAIIEAQKHGHALIVTGSLQSYQIACIMNQNAEEGRHMAVFYHGEWDAETFLKEIRYEDSLLTDDMDNTYCIGKSLYREDVFADVDGRILLRCADKPLRPSVPLCKKRDGTAWGALLLDPVFNEENYLGRLKDMPSGLGQRILLLHNILFQIRQRNDDLVPVTDSILAFRGGEALVLDWKHTLGRGFRYGDLCFSVLFGQELASCDDVMGTMLESIRSSEDVPDYFLGELERVFLLGGRDSAESWEAVLMRTRISLLDDLN